MKINISNLKDGDHIFDFNDNADEIDDIQDVEILDLKTHVVLSKYGTQYNLKIDVNGNFRLSCDRCLELYNTEFERTFDLIFKIDYGDLQQHINENDQDDIMKYISPNTQQIEIKDDVRDYILLSVPMRKVPDEENGKCVECGRDIEKMLYDDDKKEINPVWEKLTKIKKN